MNIKEFINVDSYNRDKVTGVELTHEEKYTAIIDKLGYDAVKKCVPFSVEEIKQAILTDEHLNNLPMKSWDYAGGFVAYVHNGAENYRQVKTALTELLGEKGITSWSPSDSVCILKQCARLMVKED